MVAASVAAARPRGERHALQYALAIGAFATASRIGAACLLGTPERVESFEYEDLALSLVAGQGFRVEHLGTEYRSYTGPLFSVACAAIYSILGVSHLAVIALQAFFSGVTTLAVFFIGTSLGSLRAGLLAAALTALHPALFYSDIHKLHPVGLDAMLACAGLAAALEIRAGHRVKPGLVGALHGLAVLERATFGGLSLVAAERMWRQAVGTRRLLAYLLGFSLVVSPWLVRNFFVHGVVVLATTDGEVFWLGNNPNASGGSYTADQPAQSVLGAMPERLRDRLKGSAELEQRRLFMEEARSFIGESPTQAALLFARKLGTFLWFAPQSGVLYPSWFRKAYQAYYGVMLLLAMLGARRALQAAGAVRSHALGALLFVFSVAVLQSSFYVDLRHRWAVEPLLLVFAAGGFLEVARQSTERVRMARVGS